MPGEPLVFFMGNFEASIPRDRSYSRNHLWLQPGSDTNRYRVGLTAYSVRLLQDVYFLDWTIDPMTAVVEKKEIGQIESSKALSSLYAPCAGRVLAFNEQLLDDPSAINTDNYQSGWLYEFECTGNLLTAEQYYELLEAGWEDTQRMIKGQMNE